MNIELCLNKALVKFQMPNIPIPMLVNYFHFNLNSAPKTGWRTKARKFRTELLLNRVTAQIDGNLGGVGPRGKMEKGLPRDTNLLIPI